MTELEIPLACDMSVIPRAERAAHVALGRRLAAESLRVAPLAADGAEGLRIDLGAEALEDAARWIRNERLCCPFLRFALEVAPALGAITLTLSGPEGTRAFLESEIL